MTFYKDKNTVVKCLVLFGDALVVTACVFFITWIFPEHTPHSVGNHISIALSLLLVTFGFASLAFPNVIHRRLVSIPEIVYRNFFVVFSSQFIFAVLWHMMTRNSDEEMLFSLLLAVTLFSCICVVRVVERYALRFLRSNGRNTRSVVFVGNDPANLSVYKDIMTQAVTGYVVQGYYSDNEIEEAPSGLRKLGSRQSLRDSMAQGSLHCDEIYCSLSHNESEDIMRIMKYCNGHMIHFFYVPLMQQNIQLSLKPMVVGNIVLFTNFYEPLSAVGNRMVKRTFDILFSGVVCLFLLPVIPVVALIIKRQSPGPVFFKQERTGLDGKGFMCYKFRSMHVNDEADTRQATADDPRKFWFGDFMRHHNIDELPQFFNVLKGDMSVVGPRPHMLYHTEKYSALMDKYMMRHCAKPGITGLAQVSGFRGETYDLAQMEGRIQKDIYYIENWTLWQDMRIIFRTVLLMLSKDELAV